MIKFRRSEWETRAIGVAQARRFLERHHYARGTGNASVLTLGLYRKGAPDSELKGVAVWLPPMRPAARYAASRLQVPEDSVLALSRLAIAPEVPKNAASYLMAESRRRLRRDGRWKGLITWADAGQGHLGTIYKADNWIADGSTRTRSNWIDPRTGRQVSPRQGFPGDRRNVRADSMAALGYVRSTPSIKYRFLKKL